MDTYTTGSGRDLFVEKPSFAGLLDSVAIPDLFPVTRRFEDNALQNIAEEAVLALDKSNIGGRIVSGGEVALGVGSRGIDRLPELVRAIAGWFRNRGAHPFIVPGMGSHGGATAEGQITVLNNLGITEETVGCPIRSSMEVRKLGLLPDGTPVYLDALAANASNYFIINKVKQHPSYGGPHESGLVKMLVIGMGKQKGADSCHELGFGSFAVILPAMARFTLENTPNFLGGMGLVENARDKICHIEAIPPEALLERDAALLVYAKQQLARLPVKHLDFLLVDVMGKNISGAGMDPTVLGRFLTPYKQGDISITKIAVLDISTESHGNATGIGNADLISAELFRKINYEATYTNVMTSTLLRSGCTPVVMPDDRATVCCGIKTCNAGQRQIRMIRIRDTLHLEHLLVSAAVAEELTDDPLCIVGKRPVPIRFSREGRLHDADIWERFITL